MASINASTSGGGGIITTADATGILQLQSAGTATVTVGTAGGVGIGTTTTTNAKLTVNANTALPATAPSAGTNLWVTGADATVNRLTFDSFGSFSSLGFRQSAGTAAAPTAVTSGVALANIVCYGYGATGYTTTGRATINFLTAENWTDTAQGTSQAFYTTAIGTTTQAEKMRIDDVGNVTLQKNISVGGAAPTTSGSGITFPATQSASSDANTLDDYEEGTWTPTLTFAGVTTGITYSTQNGSYTKVGRLVSLRAVISLSNKGSASGPAYITGVPFTPADATSAGRTTGSIYMGAGTGLANLFLQPLIISETSNKIDLNTFNGTADGNIANTNFTNTSYIVIQFSYFTT